MKPVTLKHYFNTRNIALVGILAAIIFVLTKFISIPIPSPLGKTALSVGNAMCILSALLFGPVTGGLAAGIGNALVDLSDPAWAPEFWITFINKFLMAFVAGLVMHHFKPCGNKGLAGGAAGIPDLLPVIRGEKYPQRRFGQGLHLGCGGH